MNGHKVVIHLVTCGSCGRSMKETPRDTFVCLNPGCELSFVEWIPRIRLEVQRVTQIEERSRMMQHYTRNTVEASAWCRKCGKNTAHRVDGVKLGACKTCLDRLNAPRPPEPEPGPEQLSIFSAPENNLPKPPQ